jgi:hypothetical protein
MSRTNKSQKIVVLAAGAAVAISATAIVLSQEQSASSVQSALRNGATNAAMNAERSGWVQLAAKVGD